VLRRLVPALAGAADARVRRPPRRALRRYLFGPVACAAAATAASTVATPEAWPVGVVLVGAAALAGAMRFADAGVAVRDGLVVLRRRGVSRTTFVARIPRLQKHVRRQTVLQRRAGLADVSATVGSGATGMVRHLDDTVAEGLFTALRPAQPAAR
jgi:putative membrane protein